MTPRPRPTKAKPRGKAMPTIYVVVHDVAGVDFTSACETREEAEAISCSAHEDVVEYRPYTPRPATSRRSSR